MCEASIKTAILFCLLPTLASCKKSDPVELPNVDDITEMRVRIIGLNRAISDWKVENGEEFKFSVPREHWGTILNTLRPYKRGTRGRKGKKAGSIILTLKDGKTFDEKN